MKEYPVGSVCECIDGDGRLFREHIGKEYTIELPQAEYSVKGDKGQENHFGYGVRLQGDDGLVCINHENLKLKKFPPDLHAKCEEFMLSVLKPVQVEETEKA